MKVRKKITITMIDGYGGREKAWALIDEEGRGRSYVNLSEYSYQRMRRCIINRNGKFSIDRYNVSPGHLRIFRATVEKD